MEYAKHKGAVGRGGRAAAMGHTPKEHAAMAKPKKAKKRRENMGALRAFGRY